MQSRMDKYSSSELKNMSRAKRNASLYSSVSMEDLSRIKTNDNISVISDSNKQIDLEKIKEYLMDNKEDNTRRVRLEELPKEETEVITKREVKNYDINSVLEKARAARETDYNEQRYKKIDEKEYNILKKIKPADNEEEVKEKETVKDSNSDLFEDLMGDDNNTIIMGIDSLTDKIFDEVTKDIEENVEAANDVTRELLLENEKLKELIKANEEKNDEISIKKLDVNEITNDLSNIDKSFYTNSMSFKKSDFGDLDDDDEEGTSFYGKFAIAMVILILIATIVIVLNYVFEFNWF